MFRKDNGTELDRPWLLAFATSAAPYAPAIGQPESGDLLQKRILRVLAIAQPMGTGRWFSAPGAVAPLGTIPTALPWIFAGPWKTISTGRSLTLCSQ